MPRKKYATEEERKAARLEQQRMRYAANPEKFREKSRRSARANADKIKEKNRLDYAANPEKGRERSRRWRENHPEKARESSRRTPEQSHRYRVANLERVRENQRLSWLKKNHGMRPEDFEAMWDAQGGLCYLGGEPLGRGLNETAIEHDHRCCAPSFSCTFCRRGLACQRCNLAAGAAGDDPDQLRRIADNLEAAKVTAGIRIASRSQQAELELGLGL